MTFLYYSDNQLRFSGPWHALNQCQVFRSKYFCEGLPLIGIEGRKVTLIDDDWNRLLVCFMLLDTVLLLSNLINGLLNVHWLHLNLFGYVFALISGFFDLIIFYNHALEFFVRT